MCMDKDIYFLSKVAFNKRLKRDADCEMQIIYSHEVHNKNELEKIGLFIWHKLYYSIIFLIFCVFRRIS